MYELLNYNYLHRATFIVCVHKAPILVFKQRVREKPRNELHMSKAYMLTLPRRGDFDNFWQSGLTGLNPRPLKVANNTLRARSGPTARQCPDPTREALMTDTNTQASHA